MNERAPLTFEALLPLLAAGDDDGTVAMLRGRTEEERRPVGRLLAEAMHPAKRIFGVPVDHETAMAATIGTAAFTAIKKLTFWHQWGAYATEACEACEACEAIIIDRNPPWLGPWVEYLLEVQAKPSGKAGNAFPFCRSLVRAGHCPRPDSDAYIICMTVGIAAWPYRQRSRWFGRALDVPADPVLEQEKEAYKAARRGRNIRTALLADPDLLDWEVWQLFSVPGRPRRMLAPPPKQHRARKSNMIWESVLADLSAEDYLDRSRLIDEALAAAARPFPPAQISWYVALHDRLDPTPDERGACADAYLHLLGAPEPAAVRFAVEQLSHLERLGRLEAGPFFTEVEPVLYTAPKVTAMAAMKMAKAVLDRDPASSTVGLCAIAQGLAHAHPDVQAAALTLIERFRPGPDVVDAVSAHAAGADPRLQDRLRGLMASGEPPD